MDHVTRHRVPVVVLIALTAAVFALSSMMTHRRAATTAVVVGTPMSLPEVIVEPEPEPAVDSTEVLWLARIIYSETKQPHEQELVAWVVRNRVETGYRGKRTYRDVVLDPWQFSAFNRNSPKRSHYVSLEHNSGAAGFKTALEIAQRVANADSELRPFGLTTRHFYSERSMRGRRQPSWAYNKRPVKLGRDVDPRRFRFYADIA